MFRGILLLGTALFWVVRVRLDLWTNGFDAIRDKYLPEKGVEGALPPTGTKRVPQAVRLAACIVPGASCLTQALAAQIMFARRNIPSTLVVGVEDSRSFAAHAWLELQGIPVLGGDRESLGGYGIIATYSSRKGNKLAAKA